MIPLAIYLLIIIAILALLKSAKRGHEDDDGFHFDE